MSIFRLFYVIFIALKYGLDEFFNSKIIKIIQFFLAPIRFRQSQKNRGERLRVALEKLGPIFVKFGQMLSTRRDLLPIDIADELAKLQDKVPPFDFKEVKRIIEQTYRTTLSKQFIEFNQQPEASASVAQVHFAKLLTGQEIAVKILRPNIQNQVKKDIKLLTWVLIVPSVYWDHCHENIMVMERMDGIPISNIPLLKKNKIDIPLLAKNGVEIFFTQVFRDGFFHADMHPGNIQVRKDGKYIALDFGIMGSLNEEDKKYLARNFVCFFKRDYRGVAEVHVESGWVPPETSVDEFENAIRSVCEPIFDKPLKEISFGKLLIRLFQTSRQFNMEVQPQLTMLQKTLLNVEGLGRDLDPDLDLWKTARPFLESWLKEETGPKKIFENIKKDVPNIINILPEIPTLLRNLKQSNAININVKKDLESTQKALEKMKIFIIILFVIVFSLYLL